MKLCGDLIITEKENPNDDISLVVPCDTMDDLVNLMGDAQKPDSALIRESQPRGSRARVFEYELGDIKAQEILRYIRSRMCRLPTLYRAWNRRLLDRYFFQSLRREYTSAELENAPFLSLYGTKRMAKMGPREDFGPLQVIGDKLLEEPKPFGRLDPYVVRGMNNWLKEELTKRNLRGFAVREIEILNRKPQHQAIWEPWSTVTMPRCCLPLYDDWGEPCGPELTKNRGCHYECGPYMSEEKVFLRSEVEALGEFDIAVCQEHVGMGNNDRFPPIVVSQRFRQVLKELKVSGVAYAPVWLKEPGEPMWTNPWEEFLGPYPERVPLARSFEKA